MQFKTLTIEELRAYEGRHGFIFQGNIPSDPAKCDKMSQVIIQNKFTESEPEFVVVLDDRTFVFIYPEGIHFNMPYFLEISKQASFISGGSFQTDSFGAWIKSVKSLGTSTNDYRLEQNTCMYDRRET